MSWHPVSGAFDLGDEGVMDIEIDDHEIAIYRLGDEFFATENICTHAFAYMATGTVKNGCIECPLHQALFDIRTGKAKSFPATVDLTSYPVKVEAGQVLVEISD